MANKTDAYLAFIGNFGRWQFLMNCLFLYSTIIFMWQLMINKFLTFQVDHQCILYSENFTIINNNGTILFKNTTCGQIINQNYYPCIKWNYDESIVKHSIISRFDLVCEKSHLNRLSQLIFFFGTFIGSIFGGYFSDKIGRKVVFFAGIIISSICTGIAVFSPNVYLWIILRSVSGASSIAVNLSSNVYRTEMLGGKWRSIVPSLFGAIPSQLTIILLAFLTYMVPNMYTVEILLSVFSFIGIPFVCLVPESPRWMILKQREDSAKEVMRNIASVNNRSKDEELLNLAIQNVQKQTNKQSKIQSEKYFDLFRYPGIRRNFLLMCYGWFSYTLGYYGLMYNTPTFGSSIHLVFASTPIFTIPLLILSPYLENKFGRKFLMSLPLTLSGCLLLITAAIPKDKFSYNWPIIVLCTLATVFCFMTLNSSYTYTKELFPTILRTRALSTASASARLGAMLSPLVGELEILSQILPLIVYGILMLSAGITSLFIWPETNNTKLPDSVEECELLAQTKNKWIHWIQDIKN